MLQLTIFVSRAHLHGGPLRVGLQLPLEIVLHQLTQRLVHRLLAPTSRGISGLSQRRSWRWRRCSRQGGENQDETYTQSHHHCRCDLPRCVGRLKVGTADVSGWGLPWYSLQPRPLFLSSVSVLMTCVSHRPALLPPADCWALWWHTGPQVGIWISNPPTDYLPRNKRTLGQNGY